jgi:hypothetical protein
MQSLNQLLMVTDLLAQDQPDRKDQFLCAIEKQTRSKVEF